MERWYVYYKVPAADKASVANRVQAMFNALGAQAPRGRLLQRADAEDDEVTLMEVYEPVADPRAFGAALERALHASGLEPTLVARRRIERFKDL